VLFSMSKTHPSVLRAFTRDGDHLRGHYLVHNRPTTSTETTKSK